MYAALAAASQTLAGYLRASLTDPIFPAFGSGMVVTLNTPQEMMENNVQGLSVWLYRVVRDEQTLNQPPRRLGPNQLQRRSLPLRLHYLITPIVRVLTDDLDGSPVTEQMILGRVLQVLEDHPKLFGVDLDGELEGSGVELHVRLEPFGLADITSVWDALDRSYQLSVSYEVSVVDINTALEPEAIAPVEVVLPEFGTIIGPEP